MFKYELLKNRALSEGTVLSDKSLCVQCGICSFNCPMGIDVRASVWYGDSISTTICLACGRCIIMCPRGALRMEKIAS